MTSYSDVFGGGIPPTDDKYVAHSISSSSELVWPENYSGTGLVQADVIELTATVAALTLTLPPANAQSQGKDIIIRNVGANSVEILNNVGASLTTVGAGIAKIFYIKDNSTAAGIWGVFTYGTGTSSADASSLAGYGMSTYLAKLVPQHSQITKNADYTILDSDRGRLINVSTGSITLTLPSAASVTDGFFVMIRNSSLGTVTTKGTAMETINGSVQLELVPGESAIYICTGSAWLTVGYGRDASSAFSEFVINSAAGNITLSSTDVAGRMIRVAGTAVGNIVVTLPTVDNIYFVTTEAGLGAFTATFTTGSGDTVALGSSQRTILYSDGTNVLIALTTSVTTAIELADGSAGVPSLRFASDTNTGLYRIGSDLIGVSAGGSTTLAIGSTDVDIGKNLRLTGTAKRLFGNFSAVGLVTDWTFLQTINANADTIVGAIPNGVSQSSMFMAGNRSASVDFAYAGLKCNNSAATINSATWNAGVLLPLTFEMQSVEKGRLSVGGRWLFGGTTDDGSNVVQVDGRGHFRGTSAAAVLDTILVTNASLDIGTEAGIFFAPTSAAGLIRGARISAIQENGGNTIGLKFYTGFGASILSRMTITGAGNVEHTNFTKLGELSPAFKIKELSGTSNAAAGGVANIAHGLTLSKIIGVQASVGAAAGPRFEAGSPIAANAFQVSRDATNIIITNGSASGANINNQPITVVVTYKE